MATYYVGKGGNNSNDGTTWAKRKLTLDGAEDTPIQAGDTVYVGAGTYREALTCDVSGTAEAGAISYIGDYDGSHTDGVGGIVRITGSNDDKVNARNTPVIILNGKNYRTFNGFTIDMAGSSNGAIYGVNCSNITLQKLYLATTSGVLSIFASGTGTNWLIENCYLESIILFSHTATVDSAGHVVQNCIFNSKSRGSNSIGITRIGGILVKNCVFKGGNYGVAVSTVPASGQTVTVNNCIFHGLNYALVSASAGFLIEDYNSILDCIAARSNVGVGTNSNTFPMLEDTRWFHEMVNGGSMLTPFDLSSYSQLINVAGTSPTTADMRGTTVQGTQREWGALEYDSTLDIEAGAGTGGSVKIVPLGGIRL